MIDRGNPMAGRPLGYLEPIPSHSRRFIRSPRIVAQVLKRAKTECSTYQSLHTPHSIIARPSSPLVLQMQYSSTSFFFLPFTRGFLAEAAAVALDDSAASTAATSFDCAFARAMSFSRCSASSARCDLFLVRTDLVAVVEDSAGVSGMADGVSMGFSMMMDER